METTRQIHPHPLPPDLARSQASPHRTKPIDQKRKEKKAPKNPSRPANGTIKLLLPLPQRNLPRPRFSSCGRCGPVPTMDACDLASALVAPLKKRFCARDITKVNGLSRGLTWASDASGGKGIVDLRDVLRVWWHGEDHHDDIWGSLDGTGRDAVCCRICSFSMQMCTRVFMYLIHICTALGPSMIP
ncbi:hypothetical protein BGZ61DRAFT_195570 [Ilyonectria robusta]|uniref:uncharacterized protein n=1 Tax=Ilyonectria robusta TaxID=1079257 RepID=UPI001E8DF683|nr:uncharacterized protein BGZ61DRAFT_195570 [Ilyonectria robusta]KAH8721834.1 hypothetical protein BGZ61DRAFT_195570 [Ilyonectria robusta]